ncbi:RNA-directed DNA polymerase from mobile element jockey [Trichonephila clavipes]|nr:RNA-directed DNA polymerase from mobile element jockey [Trichonephila clavipes]
MRPGNRALFWISTVTEHLKRPFSDWLVDTRKVSPSLRAGRLLSSAPSARFSRPLPNISWTVWVFPEKTSLQEAKLCEQRLLNAKGYNIVRRNRASGGNGLVFLICDVHFQRLPDIGNDTSDLEYLGSAITNARGLELSNLVNENAFLCLNYGSHTFRSNIYGSTDVLYLTFISPGLLPFSFWRVLDNIRSDHLPILVEIDLKVNCTGVKNLHWNFKKADWSLFENISNNLISQEPISDKLEKEWSQFKHSIFTADKSSIPWRKSKKNPYFLCLQFRPYKAIYCPNDNGHVSVDAWEAAEALAQHYANETRLDFSSSDKHFARVTRNQIKSCRDRAADNPLFNVDFTLPELSYAHQNLDTNKSPDPNSTSLDIS